VFASRIVHGSKRLAGHNALSLSLSLSLSKLAKFNTPKRGNSQQTGPALEITQSQTPHSAVIIFFLLIKKFLSQKEALARVHYLDEGRYRFRARNRMGECRPQPFSFFLSFSFSFALSPFLRIPLPLPPTPTLRPLPSVGADSFPIDTVRGDCDWFCRG
jgi:hypothetical protein